MKFLLTRTNNRVFRFSSPTNEPPIAGLNFRVRSRSSLSMIDDYGNNATIRLPVMTSASGSSSTKISSGVIPTANTIWVFRAKLNSTVSAYMGEADTNATFSFGQTTTRYSITWGSATGISATGLLDLAWHTFIFYDKRLWVLSPTYSLTDISIINAINYTTPTITISAATFGTATNAIRYFNYLSAGNEMPITIALSYIGTLTGMTANGIITWSVKHIFKDLYRVWDTLSNSSIEVDGDDLSIEYSEYGSTYLLDSGHSIYFMAGVGVLCVPYVNSVAYSGVIPAGFVKYRDIAGSAGYHNVATSIIRFPLLSKWDRSNTTIYSSGARSGFYDVSNPTDWHITELNQLAMNETFFNTNQDICFIHMDDNSVDNEDRYLVNELLAYRDPCVSGKLNDILVYTGDYNYFV